MMVTIRLTIEDAKTTAVALEEKAKEIDALIDEALESDMLPRMLKIRTDSLYSRKAQYLSAASAVREALLAM